MLTFSEEKVSRLSWRCCLALHCLMCLDYLIMYTYMYTWDRMLQRAARREMQQGEREGDGSGDGRREDTSMDDRSTGKKERRERERRGDTQEETSHTHREDGQVHSYEVFHDFADISQLLLVLFDHLIVPLGSNSPLREEERIGGRVEGERGRREGGREERGRVKQTVQHILLD